MSRILTLITVLIFLQLNAFSSNSRQVGVVDFASSRKNEILVKITDKKYKYLLSSGNHVHLVHGGKIAHFRITEKIGDYFRCKYVNNKKTEIQSVFEGMKVFESVDLNSKKKYYEFVNAVENLITIYEEFIGKVEENDDPVVIAESVNIFSDKLGSILPQINRLYSKYPELMKNTGDIPENIKEQFRRLKVLESGLRGAFLKIKEYRKNSKEVKKASLKLENIMKKISAPKK